ncbi:MAG: NUDIX hydrolase [Chloroflexi bacterium]|nr:NUDIX hydrolase [Chloroflexota bacterium]
MTEDAQTDREIYAGRVVTLRLKYVRQPDGRARLREIVEHAPGAAVVAVDPHGQVLLVRQPRPAVNASLLELPAGLVEPGEQPIDCARRELAEETGFAAERLEPLVRFYTSPGFSTELIHIFVARGLHESAVEPDPEEEIELVRMPLEQAITQVLRVELSDAKTVAGLLAYARLPLPLGAG